MNVLQFSSEAGWLDGISTYWRDRLAQNPQLRHCLASGNTPIPIYRALAAACKRGTVSFRDARIVALDEFGGLSPDDPGLCRNMLTRDLIKDIDLPKTAFHFFDPEVKDLERECERYRNLIGSGFDVVLLGVGLNGHLGMNEPGSTPECATRRVDLHPTTISSSSKYLTHHNLPTWGLTVGMKEFFASKEVWLVATGSAKAKIVAEFVKGKPSSQVPASLMQQHPKCSLFIDAAAAALL